MSGFCAAPTDDLGLVRSLLTTVDCNVHAMAEAGYHAASGPNSQFAAALTALLTIYVAIFGLRLLMGMAPLRIGDLTVTAIKIGLVLTLATSWPVYQQAVFDTLFLGPEQIAASMMGAMQSGNSTLGANPYDGLQAAYEQLQAAALFFGRISQPTASPFAVGVPFASLTLNMSSYLMIFTTLGVVLAAKVVLGLLLALGPIFFAFLLFDSTRGIFEGWLRAALAFSLVPLFATLALVIQLVLIEPQLIALGDMVSSGKPDLAAATAAFILTVVSALVSGAGLVGIFIVATGFKLPWRAQRPANTLNQPLPATSQIAQARAESQVAGTQPLPARVSSVAAAVASMDRRDVRLESNGAPHRLNLGGRSGADAGQSAGRGAQDRTYRRSAQPRRAASTSRRDR